MGENKVKTKQNKKVREEDTAIETLKMFSLFVIEGEFFGGVFLWFFLTCFIWEGSLPEHNVDCSSASQEMPQLQITDRAKHVRCWAFRGINSPPLAPSALTPVTAFITGRENISSVPMNKHLVISRGGIASFYPAQGGKWNVFQTCRKQPG